MRSNDVGYPWTREGVAEAVEATMECWPRLREEFHVVERPDNGPAASDTWDVRLGPHGACRVAQLRSAVVEGGALQSVAQALRAARPEG